MHAAWTRTNWSSCNRASKRSIRSAFSRLPFRLVLPCYIRSTLTSPAAANTSPSKVPAKWKKRVPIGPARRPLRDLSSRLPGEITFSKNSTNGRFVATGHHGKHPRGPTRHARKENSIEWTGKMRSKKNTWKCMTISSPKRIPSLKTRRSNGRAFLTNNWFLSPDSP